MDTAIDQGAGFLALVLFGFAWWVTYKANRTKFAGSTSFVFGVMGSMLFYAAPWSIWLSGLVASVLSMFSDATPVSAIMTILCLGAVVGTVIDVMSDPEYNPAAVWALIIAPVMAHGATGWIGNFFHGVFGGLSLAVLDAMKDFFGA
jgi:hypothetical protein